MPGQFHHVPLDDPYLIRYEEAHAIDSDPQSTTMAIGMVQDAVASGHPADDGAAAKVLTGPSAAMAVQATMKPFHDQATTHDKAAEQHRQLPKITGLAIREAREAVHAARELTHVGLTASRAGDQGAGRETIGHVDERFARTVERKRVAWCAVLGTVMAVYSAVMFTRVERLAAGLGWPLAFVLFAAALITVFTVGGMLVLTWWWSRGNALGDQLREYGAITDESRGIAEDLVEEYRDHARGSEQAAAEAHSELDLGERAMHDGYHTVGVGLQKAAKILDQEKVHTPGRRTCS